MWRKDLPFPSCGKSWNETALSDLLQPWRLIPFQLLRAPKSTRGSIRNGSVTLIQVLFSYSAIFEFSPPDWKPSVWLPRKVNNINARFWIWHCKFYMYRNGLFMYERCFFQMEMAVFREMMLLSSSLCRICPGKISSRFDFLIFRSISCYFFVDQSWFQLNW